MCQSPDQPAADPPRSSLLRRGVWVVVLGLILLLCVRLVFLQGWLRPARIVGGSMAESFLGPGFAVECQDCGFPFRFGTEHPPSDDRSVCPNCGYPDNPVDRSCSVPGQRVLVDRLPLVVRDPHQWESIAFYSSHDPKQLAVKRIVAGDDGLVELRDGDLFVNGKILRKSLPQLRRMRVLIHDDRFRPSLDRAMPDRWQGTRGDTARDDTHWTATRMGYRSSNDSGEPVAGKPVAGKPVAGKPVAGKPVAGIDWLRYHQWVCWPDAVPRMARTSSVAIWDHYGYNQGLSRGKLNRAHDIMLSCTCKLGGSGRLIVRLDNGDDRFDCQWSPEDGRWQLSHNGKVVLVADNPSRRLRFGLEVAICDRRFLMAIDGVSTIRYPYERAASERALTGRALTGRALTGRAANGEVDDLLPPIDSAPVDWLQRLPTLAIGAQSLTVDLSDLCVYRDIVYLGPDGTPRWTAPASLRPGEWFVLGDNSPISLDSRYGTVVPRHEMLGTVTRYDQWKIFP